MSYTNVRIKKRQKFVLIVSKFTIVFTKLWLFLDWFPAV